MPQYSRKMKSGLRWYYKISFQGKTYYSKANFTTKQLAYKAERAKMEELETELRDNRVNNDMKLFELINHRLDYLQSSKSNKYYIENKRYFKIIDNFFGEIKVIKIRKADIQQLLIEESKKQVKKNNDNYAVNQLIRSLKALFNYGINVFEISMVNPCVNISFFPVAKKVKYIPSDEEITEVLQKCNAEQKQLIEFVMGTGCRISEALKLRRSDVNNEYVILYTRKSKSSNLTPREVKYDISKLRLPEQPEARIFSEWSDRPKFLSKKTKRKWDWHNLRHRYASKLSKNGTPLFEIMSLLGHSNLETTQRYLQLLP